MAPRRAGFPLGKAATLGLSPKPFASLRKAMKGNVELGALSGCAHIVLRRGRCIFAGAAGTSDFGSGRRFGLDTLCPLHGATKPLVAAAFLTLVDEGRLRLSDPISKHTRFPSTVKGKGQKRAAAVRQVPTLRHLLAMTAGVGYEDSGNYRKAMRGIACGEIADLAGMCEALAAAPLDYQPGKRYHYSFSADLLGRVCEEVSGQAIDRFVRQRLLAPLGMRSTHFVQKVPKAQRQRMAVLYDLKRKGRRFHASTPAHPEGAEAARWDGHPTVRVHPAAGPRLAVSVPSTRRTPEPETWVPKTSAPGIVSCGGGVLSYADYGMVSTAKDYSRFCQMLLDEGRAADGTQVLSPALVRSLWRDGLAPFQRSDGRLPGWNDADGKGNGPGYWDGVGWSLLNTHLVLDGPPRKRARLGRCMWMGGGGGAFWSLDRKEGLAVVSFAPGFGGRTSEADGLGPMANDATPFAEEALEQGRKRRRGSVQ